MPRLAELARSADLVGLADHAAAPRVIEVALPDQLTTTLRADD